MSDLARLAADLGNAAQQALQDADLAVRGAGAQAVAIAQANAPVDTGYHRSSIGMDHIGPGHVEFGCTTHYGPYLEHGTYRMAPRPHIHPAADAVIPAMRARIAEIPGRLLS